MQLTSLDLSFHYLGKLYPLYQTATTSKKTEIKLLQDKLVISLAPEYSELTKEMLDKAIDTFLFKQSKRLIEKRIRHYQSYFKLKPRKITIERSIKKWGSCNHLRELTFNYLLVTKAPEAIDYVIVHEMCHMVHLNHDRSFWRLLGSIIPNYEAHEALLNQVNRRG